MTRAPFPYFGNKIKAAELVWSLLGDVPHYIEPFAGALGVLLNRPTPPRVETINDADCFVANFWRAVTLHPDETAAAADWPINEADLHARHLELLEWGQQNSAKVMGSPDFCSPKMAGWWAWGLSSWIGSGWCGGNGPWSRSINGEIVEDKNVLSQPVSRKISHISGRKGVRLQRPQLTGRQGVHVKRPHLMSKNGTHSMSAVTDLDAWFALLCDRLQHVRVLCGDWSRSVTDGVTGERLTGVFLDPPYAASAQRAPDLYAIDSLDVAHDAADWALDRGASPQFRIVFAGFEGEHGSRFTDAGWSEHQWNAPKGLGAQKHRERLWASPHCLSLSRETLTLNLASEGTS